MADIPIILLAAGGSSRMGQPKQLLPWGNQTLIENRIQTLLKTGDPVCVVLGANSNLIIPVIEKFEVDIVINDDWETGMGSSISAGIKKLAEKYPLADGVLITLIDQPLVTSEYLQNMFSLFQIDERQIIVSQSDSGWKGVPALFDRYYFAELKELKSEEGAKKIIQKYPDCVTSVKCGNQLQDMDTPEIYWQMLKNRNEII